MFACDANMSATPSRACPRRDENDLLNIDHLFINARRLSLDSRVVVPTVSRRGPVTIYQPTATTIPRFKQIHLRTREFARVRFYSIWCNPAPQMVSAGEH